MMERYHWLQCTGIGKPVTMPTCAVPSVAIKIQPQAVVYDAVVLRQYGNGICECLIRHVPQTSVLRRHARLAEGLFEEPSVVLLPRYARRETLEQNARA
jgi:hypothetical protein